MELEVGKSYKNRINCVVKIIDKLSEGDYPFLGDTTLYYNEAGRYNMSICSPHDLIEEVSDTQKKYMVYSPQGSYPKKEHESLESAITEAKRLASVEVTKIFHVIQIVKTYKANITVEEI